ncbi:ABC transporter permease [Sinomicrobium weinanense]|uniref:ABC transporter permease n=1 Tax=Sinomicrobium weinanense TaxID=2842200 RepID=A0A926Q2C4_9FLAO|nr:ABC transporter permease [Sinomicrobium weinanense]MBC9794756.1 ABC transporter permease [Sinomicrobium weinanense]MBU3125015.1 ABC transporter permease [Sinomicrobium weinanense]
MIRNYFKITWRNLWNNKTYSFLNIFGLAIGIACAGLIFLWVEDEVSFDSVFPNKDQIYAVPTNQKYEGTWRTFFEATPGPLAPAFKEEVPGVKHISRVKGGEKLFSLGDKGIYEQGLYVDPDFLHIFSLHFLQGSAAASLQDAHSIVITQKMARQFFGDDNRVVGKTLKLDNTQEYKVTGVVKDLPPNVSLNFDLLLAYEPHTKDIEWMQYWDNYTVDTYMELAEGADVTAIDKKLRGFIQEKTSDDTDTEAFLFAMNDWRLRGHFENGKQAGGRITYVRLFTAIAWIILIIACINFMNLATARSEKRANEVGVRKVLGAEKRKLVLQFITEAMVMAFLAVVISVILMQLALPQFNLMVEKQLVLGLDKPLHLLALLLITIFCGLFSGYYPALHLSAFKPVAVLKGIRSARGSAVFIRKGLVVAQFTVSIVLIISTIIVYQQVQHVKNRELGYNKDHLITMNVRGEMEKNFNNIKQDMLNTGMVENVALNSYETLSTGNNTSDVTWKGKDENDGDILVSHRFISPEFISTAGMEIIEGRDFRPGYPGDSTRVIITQSLAKLIDAEAAVGQTIQLGDNSFEVIGVIKDFVYGDMYGSSDPVIFLHNEVGYSSYMYIRTSANANIEETLSSLQAIMKKHNPAYPFEYSFVDDDFNARFTSEMLIGKLSRVFAFLAILISCLGLFGLAAYTAEQRQKEIGIRKVLGSSVKRIVQLLSIDFLKLVFIAIGIAIPIAWWITQHWLTGYAYRIEISWWVFTIAGLAAIGIALCTVSFQAMKAAMANPVKSLKTE